MRTALVSVALLTATVVAAQNGPEAPPIGFFGSYRVAADKMDPSKLPIIGAWRINFAKSDPALKAQNRFKDTGTVIYTAENGGIKQEVFLYWPPTKADYKHSLHGRCARVLLQAGWEEHLPEPAGAKRTRADRRYVAGRSQHPIS
jgi:hypothetical protein